MGPRKTRGFGATALLAALLAVAAPASAVDSGLYLAGLGLHQETGRNIYLGGIYLEREAAKPANLTEAQGSRVMEYRVVARRTSIRSLLGGMLLQSEVATGSPPDQATTNFVDAILSVVNASLYAGDSLEIRLTESNETIAALNGHELARVSKKSVADYVLMGWVGESGPSTTFRNGITSAEVDPSLLSELEANTYSTRRRQEIASWLAPEQESGEAIDGAEIAGVDTEGAPVESLEFIETSVIALESIVPAALAAREELTEVSVSVTRIVSAFTEAEQRSADFEAVEDDFMQVASLVPMPEMLPGSALEKEVDALSIREYSERLGTFHSSLVRLVYGEIRYPKRAVRRGLEGRLELDVTINGEGKIVDIVVAIPSGHKLLDDAAVDAARDAFKRGLPNEVDPVAIAEFGDFETEQLTVPVPIQFRLQ